MEPTPRVNSALMGKFPGRDVRLVCKVKTIKDDSAIVESTDGGQVEVKLMGSHDMTDPIVEIIGKVKDANSLSYLACINLGSELDMDLVNDCIELTHDPRFSSIFG